jgi:beta-glucosidase
MEKSFTDSPAFDYNRQNETLGWDEKWTDTKDVDIPYTEGVFVGYRWYEAKQKPVNFPFGFGLSYTTFSISDLTLSAPEMSKEDTITATVTVTNTGKVKGAEVVQLYVHEDHPGIERPYRELKAFKKVFLDPGESKQVTLSVNRDSLAFWDINTHSWSVKPGTFTLLIGNSAQNVQCQKSIRYRK